MMVSFTRLKQSMLFLGVEHLVLHIVVAEFGGFEYPLLLAIVEYELFLQSNNQQLEA
jgi:hypothetical protein